MSATIMSMVMRLPGSLPGLNVVGRLQPARARDVVVPGRDQDGPRSGRAQPTEASFTAPGDTRFASRDAASILGVRGSGEGFQARLDGLGHHGDFTLENSVRPRLAPPF